MHSAPILKKPLIYKRPFSFFYMSKLHDLANSALTKKTSNYFFDVVLLDKPCVLITPQYGKVTYVKSSEWEEFLQIVDIGGWKWLSGERPIENVPVSDRYVSLGWSLKRKPFHFAKLRPYQSPNVLPLQDFYELSGITPSVRQEVSEWFLKNE